LLPGIYAQACPTAEIGSSYINVAQKRLKIIILFVEFAVIENNLFINKGKTE
jgi:hypothetical protein